MTILQGRRSAGILTRILVLSFAMLVTSLLIRALPAYARSYEITSVDIDATVADDGTITVVEVREFAFDGHFNGVYWVIPEGTYEGRDVEVTILYGGELQDGQVVRFDESDSESNHTYQVRDYSSEKELKIFSSHDDEVVQFVMSYQVTGITSRWTDTGELYWKYVSDGWDEESQNVTMTLHLPIPAGETVTPEENVRAWGHGPLDGTVTFDGNDIVYYSPGVGGSEFAEARVTFPTEWLPNAQQSSTSKLQSILEEEQAWADEANERRRAAKTIMVGGLGIGAITALGSLALVVVNILKLRERNRPQFQGEYYRDVPTADHPAVLGCLYNGGTVNGDAFTATLMRLTDLGIVRLDRANVTHNRLFGGQKVEEDFLLTEVGYVERVAQWDDVCARFAEAIDNSALGFLFGTCARRAYSMSKQHRDDIDLGGNPPLYFSTIEKVAKRYPETYDTGYKGWVGQVEAAYEQRFKENDKKDSISIPLLITFFVDVLVAIVFMFFLLITEANIAIGIPVFIVIILVGIAALFTSLSFENLNREGIETKAKLKALRKWLKDFTRLGEAVPSDVILWNRLLVMAAALGVAEEVIEQLKVAAPQVLNDPYMRGVYGWYYYDSRHYSMAPMTAFNEHVNSAHSISTAKLSSSSSSSGGGGGGGFSGGGGGGFGGGGGGGAF